MNPKNHTAENCAAARNFFEGPVVSSEVLGPKILSGTVAESAPETVLTQAHITAAIAKLKPLTGDDGLTALERWSRQALKPYSRWWVGMDKPLSLKQTPFPVKSECWPTPAGQVLDGNHRAALRAEAERKAISDESIAKFLALREQVARQQASLLEAMKLDAEAPEAEKAQEVPRETRPRYEFEAVQFEALQRKIRWLMERTEHQAKQIHELQSLNRQLIERIEDLETDKPPVLRRHQPKPAVPTRSQYTDLANQISIPATSTAPSAASILSAGPGNVQLNEVPTPACEHDPLKADSTVVAITRRKSRCTVCAQVWELP